MCLILCRTCYFTLQQMQEANLIKRQSALLINEATENDRVAAAFLQMQEVNDEVSKLKSTHADEV